MRLVLLFVALVACKKVERHSDQPSPPPTEWKEVGSAQPPAQGSGSASGCLADRVAQVSLAGRDRDDCTPGDDACKIDCAAGDGSSCFYRATAIQRIPERAEEAIALFGRACELGIAIGCTNYGAALWTRDIDAPCARRVFDKACAAKEPFACGMIGRMMVASAQDPAQLAAARAYFQQICDQLEGAPCKMLANYLTANELGAFDPAIIRPLLEKACRGGDSSACQDLQSTGSR